MISRSLYKALRHKAIRAVFFNQNGVRELTVRTGKGDETITVPYAHREFDARKTSKSVLAELKNDATHNGYNIVIGKSSQDDSFVDSLVRTAKRMIEQNDFTDYIVC